MNPLFWCNGKYVSNIGKRSDVADESLAAEKTTAPSRGTTTAFNGMRPSAFVSVLYRDFGDGGTC